MFIDDKLIPTKYNIKSIYPNPFNPTTTILFSIPNPGFVSLKVYNLKGNTISILREHYMNMGHYNILWDASYYPSGIYFVKIIADGFIQTNKVVLMK